MANVGRVMPYSYSTHEKLLLAFEAIFRGQPYKHRNQSLGNWVASHLYDDLLNVNRSAKFVEHVQRDRGVRHRDVRVVGSRGRRGDGTFGELLPGSQAKPEEGFAVKVGPIGQVEVGVETKILAKAMIKQIDRVIGDLNRQVQEFKMTGGNPISVAFVGVNHADHYISFEGERSFPTTGKGGAPHPAQEAAGAIARLADVTGYNEKLILSFKATNEAPFEFEWVNFEKTRQEYAALLLRVSNEYEKRF